MKGIRLQLLGCVILFAAGNFLFWPLIGPQRPVGLVELLAGVVAMAWFGAIAAQGTLLAIWFVFAPVNFRVRAWIGAAVGLVWVSAWAIGYAVNVESFYQRDNYFMVVTVTILCLPLLACGIQAPFWLVRVFRWRIVHSADAESTTEKFGLGHIFVGTTVVAHPWR